MGKGIVTTALSKTNAYNIVESVYAVYIIQV